MNKANLPIFSGHALRTVLIIMLTILTVSNSNSQHHLQLIASGERDFNEIRHAFYEYWENSERKASDYKKFKRWEEFMLPRLTDGRLPSSGDFRLALTEYQTIANSASTARSAAVNTWQPMGPFSWEVATNGYNPGNGRVNCITVDPSDPKKIFVGAASGGLWISYDSGIHWTTTTDGLAVLGITDIYINPGNTQEVIALTGDAYGTNTPSIGLIKSSDGGLTWSAMNLTFNKSQFKVFYKFEVHPQAPEVMLVAGNGIYRSEDSGENWQEVSNEGVSDLIFHPTDPLIVYATPSTESGSNTLSMMKSTDAGVTWERTAFRFDGLNKSLGRKALAVTEKNPDAVVILATAGNSTYGGLFRSTDQLKTVELQSSTPNIFGYSTTGEDTDGQGWYDLAVAVAPDNENEIYASGVHIWKSVDGGITWEIQNFWTWDNPEHPYVHADNHTLDFANGTLYAGGDGGIFVTEDRGDTFTDLSPGLNIGQFYRIGLHPSDPDVVIGGLQDNGAYLKHEGIWKHIYGADGMEALIDHTEPSTVYSEFQDGGIIRYSQFGAVIENNIRNNRGERGGWITPFIIHPQEHKTLYFGFENVWKSVDRGDNLTRMSDFKATGTIGILKQHPKYHNYLMAEVDGTLYMTEDEGGEWKDITAGLPASHLTDATFDVNDPNRIWATFSNYESGDKVYWSLDGGTSWQNASEGLPMVPVNCILSQNSCDQQMYVGTDIGVFGRKNSQSSWEPIGNGLPNVIVREMEIHYQSAKLFVGTYGRGVWNLDIDLSLADQTLTFEPVFSRTYGDDDFILEATVDSGLDVEFVSSDPDVITINGNIASIKGGGTITITAIQRGNCNYHSVAQSQEVTINRADQSITFEPLQERYTAEGSFELVAQSTSGLPVEFESSDQSVIFVFNNTATIRGEGIVTITAVQKGNQNYNPAEPVEQTQAIVVLSISDPETGIEVYPNPLTGDVLTIYIPNSNKRTEVLIYDLHGRVIREKEYQHISDELRLSVGNLDKGLYVLSINGTKITFMKK